MKCPSCGSDDLPVQDSRPIEDAVRRRRVCVSCSARWVTVERIEDTYVPKQPGRPAGEPVAPRKPKAPKPERGKALLKKRGEARRRVEEMKDAAVEDYSMYDDLAEVGHLWK